MSRKSRITLITAAVVCSFVLLLSAGLFYALQTNWLKEKVRERIVLLVEEATGGRVELGTFNFDWRTLTAEFGNLTIHGTEPKSGPPLFRAKSARVALTVVSLLKQQANISSLTVDRPEIYVLRRADGTTNIPAPKMRRRGEIVQELLNLKVRHFALNQGTIQDEIQRIPLSARGENLGLVVSYNCSGPRYDVTLSSHQLHIESAQFPAISAELGARVAVERDRIVMRDVLLRSGASVVNASGTMVHFTHPEADFKIKAQILGTDFAGIVKLPELRSGHLTVNGTAHYDQNTDFTFNGKVAGRDLTYASRSVAWEGGEFESDVAGAPQELRFTNLSFSALGGRFAGAATLKQFQELQLDGKISHFEIRDIGRFYTAKPLPWSGVASGPVHFQRTLRRNSRDLIVRSDLQISPTSGGIPVSGNVGFSYRERGERLAACPLTSRFPKYAFVSFWHCRRRVTDNPRQHELERCSACAVVSQVSDWGRCAASYVREWKPPLRRHGCRANEKPHDTRQCGVSSFPNARTAV